MPGIQVSRRKKEKRQAREAARFFLGNVVFHARPPTHKQYVLLLPNISYRDLRDTLPKSRRMQSLNIDSFNHFLPIMFMFMEKVFLVCRPGVRSLKHSQFSSLSFAQSVPISRRLFPPLYFLFHHKHLSSISFSTDTLAQF